MRTVAIVLCLLLLAGCGGSDSVEPTSGGAIQPTSDVPVESTPDAEPTATAASDPCKTAIQEASSRKLASIAPPADTSRTLATSWVYFGGINELAWASHLIVRGRVVADCGADTQSDVETIPDFDMRMLVEIDALYRGQPRETILVPATSDGFSSDPAMTFQIGDEVVLFLSEPAQGGAFPTGGPQGHWRVLGDRVVPNAGHYPNLPVETFVQSLAAALHGEPPTSLEIHALPLDVAPLGPDLPIGSEPPAACDSVVPPPNEYIERSSDIVWLSERIVIGTISEAGDSFYPDTDTSGTTPGLRVPVTDYVVRVEQHLRGTPVESVTLRQLGGTVDGCEVLVHGAPDLSIGDRLLLFLTPVDAAASIYGTTAGQRGLWQIGDDGALAANTAWQTYPQVVPTDDLTRLVATALNGEIPQDQWAEHDPVPLDASPLGDTNWPALASSGPVSQQTDPEERLAVDLPDGWIILPSTEEHVITVASGPDATADEPVPPGQVRLTIDQTSSDHWFDDQSSIPISVAGTSGWLYFYTSPWPVEASVPGQSWEIHANYLQAESGWVVQATFGSQPLADDPATHAFFTLLRSIRHR